MSVSGPRYQSQVWSEANHEFRTHLTAIKALMYMLKRRVELKKYKELSRLLIRTEDRVDELTGSINKFFSDIKLRNHKWK